MDRQHILELLDPFNIRPNLREKTDGELKEALGKATNNFYEFKHEHYEKLSRGKPNQKNNAEEITHVRPMDQYKTERLVEDNIEPDDDDLLKVLQMSIKEDEERRRINAEREKMEDSMDIPLEDFFGDNNPKSPVDTSVLDFDKFNGKPSTITDDFIVSFYESLKSNDRNLIRNLLDSLPLADARWMHRLKCGQNSLRNRLSSEEENLHLYFSK